MENGKSLAEASGEVQFCADATRWYAEEGKRAYTKRQIYQYVTLPLALRVCLPALGSNLINLVKTITAAYAIAVPETLYMANQIWSDEFNVPEMMNVAWLVYLALVGIAVFTRSLERRFAVRQ